MDKNAVVADISSKQEEHPRRDTAIRVTSTSKCIAAFWLELEGGREVANWRRFK